MKECHTVKVDMGTCPCVSSVVPSSIIDNLVILNHEISENCLHGDYNWQSYGDISWKGEGGEATSNRHWGILFSCAIVQPQSSGSINLEFLNIG